MPFTVLAPLPVMSKIKKILFLSLENRPIHSLTVEYARFLQQQSLSPLWIDGNLGNSDSNKIYDPLDKMLQDKAAISKTIRRQKDLSILSGKANKTLLNCSKTFQHQFLCDLNTISIHFDKLIVSLMTSDNDFQDLWLSWAESRYLFFSSDNFSLEKTAQFLINCPYKIQGLISTDSNSHQSLLAWIRLKQIVGEVPPLITDIKKIAP